MAIVIITSEYCSQLRAINLPSFSLEPANISFSMLPATTRR